MSTRTLRLDDNTWVEFNSDFQEAVFYCKVHIPQLEATVTTQIKVPFEFLRKILKLEPHNETPPHFSSEKD